MSIADKFWIYRATAVYSFLLKKKIEQ